MLQDTGLHPGALKDQVCSPGGATIRAVNHLAAKGFNSAIIEAEIAAYDRSVELGKA
jgi:pyrroline-5-carboxylate reductase